MQACSLRARRPRWALMQGRSNRGAYLIGAPGPVGAAQHGQRQAAGELGAHATADLLQPAPPLVHDL